MDLDDNRHDRIRPIQWRGDHLLLLDQRRLPFETVNLRCDSATDVAHAIRELAVRGAPAIGISAAWGVVLAGQGVQAANGADAERQIAPQLDALNASRPTAVNLMWAIRRMRESLLAAGENWLALITAEAGAIAREDLAANRRMGQLGAALIAPGSGVFTHCNTGSLATAGFGTALGVIRAGVAEGRIAKVYAGETRPWGQGARLTAWELQQDGIPPTLIADSAAAHLMKTGAVQWLIVGADRICANGDTANKIGTYGLALAAARHGLPFVVVAPSSTVDASLPDGGAIVIEERAPEEVTHVAGSPVAPKDAPVFNPAFDVTPVDLITAVVTEHGVVAGTAR